MILRRRKAPKLGLRTAPQLRSPRHLKFVRGFDCVIADQHTCRGKIEACHVRTGTDGGMGVKPSDCFAYPGYESAHDEQHRIGEAAFERKYGIRLRAIVDDLWKRSPHRMKAEKNQARSHAR
jgi:hypothetical protein